MESLTITLIQSDLSWENPKENLEMFSKKISAITEKTDLILLPEMFTTGFSMAPEKFAEDLNGPTVQWMKEKAREKNCVITGSFVCLENDNFYNRLIWMNPDGAYSVYDKRHLFSMGDENHHYAAGHEKIIEEINGWKICPLICYDLRFPVWSRNTEGFDLLIYIANWPERRSHPWKTLLLARAIENQCYVAGLNRIGKDGNQIYHSGDSAVINFKGEIISDIPSKEESTKTITLNYEELVEFRKVFPVLKDADRFEIK
ncbi:MAG: Nitrilase/cyanide hydratase and apolipoprotein N-acyltransferase [Bacteroidota bacterium]|jgi:predicted amidohydrolase|nr:Nitrilase/cyanide hydratase and apolipoprotein N-acyltransferase [Bacteroidota bacterium]